MKKRMLSVALAAMLFVLAVFSFAACDGDEASDPPDTFFNGALSEDAYVSASDAAKGFLEKEVAGEVTDAVFVAYEKKGDLTENEIADLDLTADEKAAVEHAERGEIEYAEREAEGVRTAAFAHRKVKVYVIYINSAYRYYSPALENGDVLTKAYYDAVFDRSKYVNFTLDSVSVSSATYKQMGIKLTLSSYTNRQVIKYDGKYAYSVVTDTSKTLTVTETTEKEWFYVFDGDAYGRIIGLYEKTDGGEWISVLFSSVNVGDMGVVPSNDYSYFVKTTSGFKVNEEKYSMFMNDVLDMLSDSLDTEKPVSSLRVNCEFFVRDGKLSRQVLNGTFKLTDEGANADGKIKVTQTYRDFGMTAFDVPDVVIRDFA